DGKGPRWPAADAASGCASGSVLRGARRSNSPTGSVGFGLRSSGFGVLVLQVRRVLEVLVLENQNQNPERRTPNPSGFYAPTRCGPAACGLACGCCCELCCGLTCGWLPLRCMSTLPRKCAPSAIATRGEMMSPSTDPLSRMSTLSLAVTFPVTSPSTITAFANTCALMRPLGPIVST